MEIVEIENLLLETKYEPFIGNFHRITFMDYLYDNLYKIGNSKLGYFALKIRKAGEKNVTESIKLLEKINDEDNFINKNIEVIEKNSLVVIISEWLNGIQPINNKKDTLSKFFSKLAILNKNNIVEGPFTSMYMDGQCFNSIRELVDMETSNHVKQLSIKLDTKILMDIMDNLKKGIPCVINEDMNCGNFFITKDGKYKTIDTEWISMGNNLYQFQHFDYFGFSGKKWHNITEEAEDCYRAYFENLEIGNAEANEQIRAIELLNTLRENTYWKNCGKENDKEIERRIETIVRREKYI